MFESKLKEEQKLLKDIEYRVKKIISLNQTKLYSLQEKFYSVEGKTEREIDLLVKNIKEAANETHKNIKKYLNEILKLNNEEISKLENEILILLNDIKNENENIFKQKFKQLIIFEGEI